MQESISGRGRQAFRAPQTGRSPRLPQTAGSSWLSLLRLCCCFCCTSTVCTGVWAKASSHGCESTRGGAAGRAAAAAEDRSRWYTAGGPLAVHCLAPLADLLLSCTCRTAGCSRALPSTPHQPRRRCEQRPAAAAARPRCMPLRPHARGCEDCYDAFCYLQLQLGAGAPPPQAMHIVSGTCSGGCVAWTAIETQGSSPSTEAVSPARRRLHWLHTAALGGFWRSPRSPETLHYLGKGPTPAESGTRKGRRPCTGWRADLPAWRRWLRCCCCAALSSCVLTVVSSKCGPRSYN